MDQAATRRKVLSGGLAIAASLPAFRANATWGAEWQDSYLALVHPELRAAASRLLSMEAKQPPLSAGMLPAHRKGSEAYSRTPSEDISWKQVRVPNLEGGPDVTVYVVNAQGAKMRPAILHTHGGGFVMGSAKSSIHDLQELCRTLDCVAVSVEYRLAPETTYTGSIIDNYTGLKWLHDNAQALGVDPKRIALLGESAGGGHAAALAIAARDRGEVPVAFQCLVYPMLDDRTGSTRQVPQHVGRLIWTAQSNRFGWSSFLGMAAGGKATPARAAPARFADLSGLPPAFIGVGSLDLFHDEDVDYAQRLNAAATSTELVVVPGAFHGFDNPAFKAGVSRRFTEAKLNALRRGLGITAAP